MAAKSAWVPTSQAEATVAGWTYFRHGLDLIERLRESNIATADLAWLLPADMLRGVIGMYGVRVQHVDGLTRPMLAHSFKLDEEDAAILRSIVLR